METRFFFPCAAFFILACTANAEGDWKSLFNGKDLSGWTVTLDKHKPGEDPEKMVQVRDGAIHMYPDTDPSETVPFGVITHEDTFSRFHLTLEYRWLDKKFAPRKDAIRDAGLLYHVHSAEKIWPDSLEYQIQEGDTADIVLLQRHATSWKHPQPDSAPEGQGDAGLLPENGGVPIVSRQGFLYLGRFPEYDHLRGWNQVEVIVHANESAEHRLNGHVRARLGDFRMPDGAPLSSGKICLQLEGAELQYRNVQIRELDEPLRSSKPHLALSAVKDKPARSATITVKNPLNRPVPAALSIEGVDAAAFSATAPAATIGAGESMEVTVHFKPVRGAARYSAGLRVGSPEQGTFVLLQGIGLAAFEGKNEPPLQDIVNALGIPLNAGGTKLELDTKVDVIGDSKDVRYFVKAGEGKVRITPLARFSPPGATPFGIVAKGTTTLVESGKLATSAEVADSHQSLLPPLEGEASSVEIDTPEEGFAFYLNAHQFVSFTDPGLPSEAKIARTARVYPARLFAGRELKDAFIVGFEEAANGDYQDALFLLENVKPAP
ncbi:DUF1080 domain-containing protein [Luteolibacter flavescens]|uniref:DUF1080 domain-containing protein n=1 Tax=Luteolibacter flavescens TaxID=1859460 RepID=A0ABT3FTK1_9BACT|nr:DUF1080 domain-containing protein [Luteolibacter flavescens]MCW1886901.1 DUF1080 domain-containing protein [Luteolibacter flavescens]